MTQKELLQRNNFKCIHHHSGLSHPECFNNQKGLDKEIIGFADIEASSLNASFGLCYTYCIKELDGKLLTRSISLSDLYNADYDKNLLKQFIEDSKHFTRLIWHYGIDRKFDLPFLRSRAVKWNLPFPQYKSLYVSDTHPILKNKFKLHSNRLEAACDFLGIPSKKHKLNTDIWLMMITGNKRLMQKALNYIRLHNQEDVLSLEALWKRISPYTKIANTSI